jgi:hypothetical protein
MIFRMTKMRKITAFVPAELLEAALGYTGQGITETLRVALERLAHQQFYDRLREMRGKLRFDDGLDELRKDKEYDDHGNVR